MPEIMYSDVEITAKVVMDPMTMSLALEQITRCLRSNNECCGAAQRLCEEMRQVLSRLDDMSCLDDRAREILRSC